MKNLCENNLSICKTDGKNFIVTNKETGKEFIQKISHNKNYALSLVLKWGFSLCKNVKEKELVF